MLSIHSSRATLYALVAMLPMVGGASALAGDLRITVENNQPGGGFAFSPVWLGVHDGTYRTFTAGETVSASLQAVAELGSPAQLAAAFTGHGSQAIAGSAPIGPGGSASTTLSVSDPTVNRYLSFASMVVPSNDFFFASQDPMAYALFDAAGHFSGPLTIQIFGSNVWDAGSEVNDIDFGPAFIAGENAADRISEGGVITRVFGGPNDYTTYLASIDGRDTPYGYSISHLITPGDLIATITITSVPEPSTFVMLGIGAGGFLLASRRRASRRNQLST